MTRVPIVPLIAALVVSGWITQASASSSSYITPEGISRMMSADATQPQWKIAQQICLELGLSKGTKNLMACSIEYQMHSLRKRFEILTETIAQKHGLCIDRNRSEMTRCEAI